MAMKTVVYTTCSLFSVSV